MPATTTYKLPNNQTDLRPNIMFRSEVHWITNSRELAQTKSLFNPFESSIDYSESERQLKMFAQLKDFSFSDFEAVYYFINDNQLLGVLLDVPAQATKYFGADSKLHVEIFHDEEENHKILTLFIGNNLEPEQAYQQEQLLYTEWFLKNYANLTDKLSIRECPMFD